MANKLNTARQYVRENYNNGEDFRWDVLSGKLQMKSPLPSIGGDPTPLHPYSPTPNRVGAMWQDLDSRKINTIACDCAEQTGVSVSPLEIRTVLNSEDIPSVNPLRAYLQSLDEYIPENNNNHSWIDWLSSQVKVKESFCPSTFQPIILSASQPISPTAQAVWQHCFRKWFVAMVASWLYDDVVNQQVLVLIGRQGIYKTTWLEHLLPPCLRAYGTKMANVRDLNKDERMRIAEFGLINMDEIDSMNDRELNQLKSLVTCSDINERAAYGYTKERRIRVASFCASGNNREFLTDQTGNRRWLPFDVESIENPFAYGDGSVFPYDQIYGEALYLLRMGFNYWFDLEDISALETHVESFQKVSNEAELLTVYFSPAQPGDAGAEFMTAAEISALLVSYGGIRVPMPINKLGSVLKKAGFIQRVLHGGKRGYVLMRNVDIDNQRKLQARSAIENTDGVDGVSGACYF